MNVTDILDELELAAMMKTRNEHPDPDVQSYLTGHADGTLLACQKIRAVLRGQVPAQHGGTD